MDLRPRLPVVLESLVRFQRFLVAALDVLSGIAWRFLLESFTTSVT
jgi:hypothetical protein